MGELEDNGVPASILRAFVRLPPFWSRVGIPGTDVAVGCFASLFIVEGTGILVALAVIAHEAGKHNVAALAAAPVGFWNVVIAVEALERARVVMTGAHPLVELIQSLGARIAHPGILVAATAGGLLAPMDLFAAFGHRFSQGDNGLRPPQLVEDSLGAMGLFHRAILSGIPSKYPVQILGHLVFPLPPAPPFRESNRPIRSPPARPAANPANAATP